MSLPPPSAAPASMPYKLFDYFVEAEQKQFYGRERDVEEVVARITSSRTLVLYGRSGIGKTSLIRAGVIPALAERGFTAVYVRLFRTPLEDLRAQVAAALGTAPGPLLEVVAACDKPVVILLDQIEELFIRFERPEDRQAVAAELESLLTGVGSDGSLLDVRLVLSLRQDWVASLEDLGPAWSDLLDRRYRLRGLSAFGARRAIVQPLAEAKGTFTPKLVNFLVDELDASGFDPLLLQILCSEVYREAARRSPEAVRADAEDHFAVGGAEGIFLHYLNKVAEQVPGKQQLLLRLLLDAMITTERTKRVVTVDGLFAARFRATRAQIEAMLGWLVEGRLVRAQAGRETWYELVHDRLVEVTLAWLERDHNFVEFRFARSLVQDLSGSPRWQDDSNKLLSRGQLEAVVGPYREWLRPDEREVEFLVWSAVAAKSGELGYWAGQYGTALSAGWAFTLLESRDASLRNGAVWAAGTLGVDPQRIARCRELALRDPNEAVRRAAGWQFAALASPSQVGNLWTALNDPSTREAALEVLTQVIRAGRHVPSLLLRDQQLHSLVETRIHEEHGDDLAARSRAAMLRGALAALVWCAVVPLASLDVEEFPSGRWKVIPVLVLLSAVAWLPISIAVSHFAVCAAAYAEHFGEDVHWWRIVLGWRVALSIAIPLAISQWVIANTNALTLALVAGVLGAAMGIIVAILALTQRILKVGRSGSSWLAWATALVCAASLPLVPWRLLPLLAPWAASVERVALVAGLPSSMAAWILVVVLGLDARRALRASPAAPKPPAPPPADP